MQRGRATILIYIVDLGHTLRDSGRLVKAAM